ncbi:MAG: flagellar filament capping protein FliD [Sulfurospirillum sp.]|nr:flagellar filament capping protein FliD [Sulfurospirillum sp.]
MASSISSLGIGSDGVLSFDVIDQLRNVDEKAQIAPIDDKIEQNTTRQSDLSILTTLSASLKSATSVLADELTYLQRSSSTSDDSVSISAQAGSSVQDINIVVNALAKNDIYQSDVFTSQSATFATAAGTLTFNVGGAKTYDIDITTGTTLSELKDTINNQLDGVATASILNVGKDEYRLIIKADDTGLENAITISSLDTSASDLGFDNAINHINTAQDASFKFNGVTISRTSNTIDDLVVGLSLTLNKVHSTDESTNIKITQDWKDAKDAMSSLVGKYNELINNLNETTKYNSDFNIAGSLQGVSEINSLKSSINRQLLTSDELGRSLVDYGINLNEGGLLEFNSTTFESKISEDPRSLEDFLRGSTTVFPNSYSALSVSATAFTLSGSDFSINGTQISLTTTGSDAQTNALTLLQAINNANISGIEAVINPNGTSVKIVSSAGYDIKIEGDSAKLELIGMSATNIAGKSTTRDGFFTDFNDLLNSYINSKDGILTLLDSNFTNLKNSYIKERASSIQRLDSKYDTLAQRFASYDSIISKLNGQFQSLSMMIEQSYSKN